MLDLYKLQIFAAVAEAGSFSKAAERFHMTQSGVSQHIKALEAGLGRQLFQRGWRGVALTPEGETLYGYARQILALAAEAENALADVQQFASGRITLGATPGVAVYLAPDWIQRFRARYPQLTVAVQTGVTSQVVADVLDRRLDAGFIEGELETYRQPRLAALALAEIEQFVVVGFKHPWWERERVAIEELDGQSFTMRPAGSQTRAWLEQELRARAIQPVIGAEFDNLESLKRAVASGPCLTILPRYAVQQELDHGLLRVVAVEGRPLRRTLKLIWSRDSRFSPIMTAFLEMLAGDYPALAQLTDTRPPANAP